MLGSLNTKLLLAFAGVICLTLAISAAGTVLLLRDQQQEAAEERVGGLPRPATVAAAFLEFNNNLSGGSEAQLLGQLERDVRSYADAFDVRMLIVDSQGRVVVDTGETFMDEAVPEIVADDAEVTSRGGSRFVSVGHSGEGGDWRLFAAPSESLTLTRSTVAEVQDFSFFSSGNSDAIQDLLSANRVVPAPTFRPVVAVREEELASAWRDLIPQLIVGGLIALGAGVLAAYLISRSITGPLARITRAAQQMARGDYEQELPVAGDDEVGRLGRAFNVMSRQVSRSHQMMRDLLANVSHELRTPLTSIQGFSQALEDGDIKTPEQYREAGRIINEEAQRMRRLIDDLMELSKLESGQITIERELVDLDALLRECGRRFERRARDTDTGFHVDVPELPEVVGDERRLEQVFNNLIDNAVRHTPPGGAVNVRAEAQNGVVRVAVHNTGSFIPNDEIGRVFERFYQLERHRSRASGGAGLGLAIASEVVQAHSGVISATSDAATGTEFEVTLPVHDGA
jgi:signal transduction histidine kinase